MPVHAVVVSTVMFSEPKQKVASFPHVLCST